jgi:hypothetical protein
VLHLYAHLHGGMRAQVMIWATILLFCSHFGPGAYSPPSLQ